MTEGASRRPVVRVLMWHRGTSQIAILYSDGDRDEILGTEEVAARLARDERLARLSANEKTATWVDKH